MEKFLEVRDLSKYYEQDDRKIYALKDINLSIEKGDIYGIIGESGAGKSTLIRLLASLLKPSNGHILFQGIDISMLEGKSLREFRQNIGMIFQHFNLLTSRTAAENISYPMEIAGLSKEEREKKSLELLRLVNLSDKQDAHPLQLSGGEKQRVGIARAIATNPEILFCDEATSALDPRSTKEILDLIKNIHQRFGITIILITHEMDVIKRICNKVAVLEKGKIVEQGAVEDLFFDPKHPTTKQFLQSSHHEIPAEFFKDLSPSKKLLRLRFKGKSAGEPLMSQMVKRFDVETNILLGWIDKLRTITIGTLIIELRGLPENIKTALKFLKEQDVHFEEIERVS